MRRAEREAAGGDDRWRGRHVRGEAVTSFAARSTMRAALVDVFAISPTRPVAPVGEVAATGRGLSVEHVGGPRTGEAAGPASSNGSTRRASRTTSSDRALRAPEDRHGSGAARRSTGRAPARPGGATETRCLEVRTYPDGREHLVVEAVRGRPRGGPRRTRSATSSSGSALAREAAADAAPRPSGRRG